MAFDKLEIGKRSCSITTMFAEKKTEEYLVDVELVE